MYNQQQPQPDILIEFDDYGESDLPTGYEIDFFIREELALVLEKAQRQFKAEVGETFIEEVDIVIEGFIEDELMAKIDILEQCFL